MASLRDGDMVPLVTLPISWLSKENREYPCPGMPRSTISNPISLRFNPDSLAARIAALPTKSFCDGLTTQPRPAA